MPLEFLSSDEVPKTKRKTKIDKSGDWQELIKVLNRGFSKDQTVRLAFSDATKKPFGGSDKKTAQSFVFRLRSEFRGRYRVRLIEGNVYISNLEKKKKPGD